MNHFQKLDGSIWAFELDGSQDQLITDDMISLSAEQLDELRKPTHAELVERTKKTARVVRLPIIGILDGMQVSALVKGDSDGAQSIEVAKQGLKDITKIDLSTCTSAEEMTALIMGRYAQIAARLPAAAVVAFAQVLA